MPESLTPQQSDFQLKLEQFARQVQAVVEERPDYDAGTIKELSQKHGIWDFNHPIDPKASRPTLMDQAILYDTLGSFNLIGTRGLFGPSPGILANVNEPLRSQYLIPLLEGQKRAAFGFTEPDDAERATHGSLQGDELVVNGQKSYVTGGADADFINTLVELDGLGPAVVIIDRLTDGVTIDKVFRSTDGSHHAYMRFVDVRVPMHNIVGEPGEGMPRAMTQITNTRLVFAAQSAGLARWVIDYVSRHIQAPHRSGQPLATREGVRLRYADMRIKAYAARSMVYRTARLADAGENFINEVIASKVFATEMIGEVVDTAIQLVGGNALRAGHPLESLQRTVRTWRLAEGASDILRLNLVRGDLELNKGRI